MAFVVQCFGAPNEPLEVCRAVGAHSPRFTTTNIYGQRAIGAYVLRLSVEISVPLLSFQDPK